MDKGLNFGALFENVAPSATKKYSKNIFDLLKPFLVESLESFITSNKKGNKGPKPKKENISKVLDAIFEALDTGTKMDYLQLHHKVSRGTYYRYLALTKRLKLFEGVHRQLLEDYKYPSMGVVDASHIRSINGSEGLNYGYKEVSKKALKITIIADTNKVIYIGDTHPDNLPDHLALQEIIGRIPSPSPMDLLADAGYNGRRFKEISLENGYTIISLPKNYRSGSSKNSSPYQKILLKMHRSKVEHVFSQLKRFRGIQVKSSRTLSASFSNLPHIFAIGNITGYNP